MSHARGERTEIRADLATELVPVLVFIGIGVLFWRMGKTTRLDITSRATAGPTDPPPMRPPARA